MNNEDVMKLVNKETDHVWTDDSLTAEFHFVANELGKVGIRIQSQEQSDALTRILEMINKATTKQSLIATINLLTDLNVLHAE